MTKLVLLALGGLKFGKLAASGGTMLLSLVSYAAVYGWRYAVGFVGLVFAHEMGHFIAARQRGLAVGAPTFIPFVGAWVELRDRPANAETQAHIAFAGPFLGTLATFAVYGAARFTDSPLLLAIAYSGFFLNLVNLLPVSPLDGGRITAIVSPRIWLIGAPLMLALMAWRPNPVFVLVAVMALPQIVSAVNGDPSATGNRAFHRVSTRTRIEFGVLYIALAVVLGLMTYAVHEMMLHVPRP